MNLDFIKELPAPEEIKKLYPITDELKELVAKRDKELKDILSGNSNKMLLVIGPCSADNAESVMEYMHLLKEEYDKYSDKLFIVPRIYTNKPRTTGMGYKGMLHQPNPNEKEDMLAGIVAIRKLHMRALSETGFSCADEMLYPDNHLYLNDLLAYVAVGARSVEDQHHRLTASGLNIPVGMKNPTEGDVTVMMNAIAAAQNSHTFIYHGWEVRSKGNPYAHGILRGYLDKHSQSMPNYHYEDLVHINELYQKSGVANPAIIIDCNHSNSNKDPFQQGRIIKEVMHNCSYNSDIGKLVKGFMVESYLVDGNQKPGDGVYGKSITDACIGWDKTKEMLEDIYTHL